MKRPFGKISIYINRFKNIGFSQTNLPIELQTYKQFDSSNILFSPFQRLNHYWYHSLSIYLIQNFTPQIKVSKNSATVISVTAYKILGYK